MFATQTSLWEKIHQLHQQKLISDLDYHFTRFIAQLAGEHTDDALIIAALLTSYLTTEGHICVDLAQYATQSFPSVSEIQLNCPTLENWLNSLQRSPVVGRAGQAYPLILQENRLYLQRYWQYEKIVGDAIQQRLQPLHAIVSDNIITALAQTRMNSLQRQAVQVALQQHFCIISGGAGTGKTTTVANILQFLLQANPQLRIALAAPTGKAAARLKETLSYTMLDCDDTLKKLFPQQTYTLHRLLGAIPGTPHFHHTAQNPLLYDVVVIDEASMVDLALMAKLLQALLPETRLILLGDKDQLASVEAGCVLGDICAGSQSPVHTPLAEKLKNSIVLLQESHRFKKDSGIGALATAVKQGAAECAFDLLTQEAETHWYHLPENFSQLSVQMEQSLLTGFHRYLHAKTPEEALNALENFRVLSAFRQGRYGVENLNRLIEKLFQKQGVINTAYRWYHLRPILITCNDYNLNLFNGDVGVIFRKRGEILAYFRTENQQLRHFYPNRLPEHETVFAMTIHKSQGSEFQDVLLLLPDQDSPLLTRELIYTGLTRAKQTATVFGNPDIFKAAIGRRIQRHSGLQATLWGTV